MSLLLKEIPMTNWLKLPDKDGILQSVKSFEMIAEPNTANRNIRIDIFRLNDLLKLINDKQFANTYDLQFTDNQLKNPRTLDYLNIIRNGINIVLGTDKGQKKYLLPQNNILDWFNQMRSKLHNLSFIPKIPRSIQEKEIILKNKTIADPKFIETSKLDIPEFTAEIQKKRGKFETQSIILQELSKLNNPKHERIDNLNVRL